MDNKDYHQIMTEITSNLTGDPEKDKAYLLSKCDEYKTHEMSKEILRGIGRLIYTILPDDVREGLDRASNNEFLGWKATLDEIDFCLYKKDYGILMMRLTRHQTISCSTESASRLTTSLKCSDFL